MKETFIPFDKDNNKGRKLEELLEEEGFNIYEVDINLPNGSVQKKKTVFFEEERICSFNLIDDLVKEGKGTILIMALKEAIVAGKALGYKEIFDLQI